jgi:MFS family permease
MQDARDPYGALRQRNYRRYLAGNLLYTLGIEMQAAAVGWELAERAGTPEDAALALGFTGLAQFLPVLLLAIPAGHTADRFDGKRVLIAAQLLAMVSSLGLAILSYRQAPFEIMYVCLVLVGVARAFNVPARWRLLPEVIPPELLPNAVTWNSSGFQIANVAGPAVGGRLLAWLLPSGVYLSTALCLLGCVGLISTIRPSRLARLREPPTLQSLLAGIRFVWETKPILAAITLDLFAVLLGGATSLLPIYARDILHVDANGYGWLRAAPAIGALAMGFLLAHHPPLRHAGRTLLATVAGFGLATIVFGFSTSYPLSLAMLMATGAFDNVSVVIRGTLVQTLTPEAMRGRVGAVNIVFVSSSNEMGAFESGVVAKYFGPIASVVSGGIGCILVVVSVMALWPPILRLSLLPSARPGEPIP